MPYNGVGQFTSLGAPIFPAVPNTFILASYFNSTMNDVFLGLSGAITRDGQAPATANLPMAGFTLTNIAAAVANWQPLAYGQSGAKLNELTVDALLTIPDAASVTLAGDVTATATSISDYTLGTLRVATQTTGDSTTNAASTAFVADAITSLPGGSLPALTGQAGGVLVVNPDETTVSWEKRYQGDITGDSTSSVVLSVATGKVFTTQSGKGWTTGDLLTIYYNASNYMSCRVVSYSGTTLTVDCFEAVGSGTYAAWAIASGSAALYRLPIFSPEAVSMHAASVLESITPQTVSLPSGAIPQHMCVGNSLFLYSYTSANAVIGTSPDGITWTHRAMPSSAIWALHTNGVNKFIATIPSSTTVASSVNGTVWTAATSLPGAAHGTYPKPTFNGDTCLVPANSGGCYISTDNGVTWSSLQSLPASIGSEVDVINGLFWYFATGTTAYTSPTGLTGSWTSRALPFTPYSSFVGRNLDGSFTIMTGDPGYKARTVDGINWTTTSYLLDYHANMLEGVYATFIPTFGQAKSWHAGLPVLRTCTGFQASTGAPYKAARLGNIICTPNLYGVGLVGVFNLATYAPSALFTR